MTPGVLKKNKVTQHVSLQQPGSLFRAERGQSSALDHTLKLADSNVSVREGGEIVSVDVREAVLRATLASAVKGNPRSQGLVMQMFMRADAERARKLAEEIALWRDYQQKAWAAIETAKKKGPPPPAFLPHPDDIILDAKEGVLFIGPVDEFWQTKMEETIRYRDALIMQDALDGRSDKRLDGEPMREPGAAGLCALLLEKSIPPRLRLTDVQWVLRMMKYEGMPKRALMKELYAAWRDLGKDLPRGYVFPERTVMANNIEMIMSQVREMIAAEA
ncbi:DUF5681 domain-containing protein [Rhizobium sp. FKL33]|uniref:DUF5681 domain-containing protein n=1 Tax=Rhizobium sp. FKL33 TaxID=2562307 RepID=UPI0010C07B4D|nr:DUF5681 domain-containing protein [Rhizobium sp. FKL33]